MHNARNYSQHRGSITDSLSSQEYMKWLCKFVNRFAKDNFRLSIIQELPLELKLIWTKLTNETVDIAINKELSIKSPLRENYRTVAEWLRKKRINSRRGFLTDDYIIQLESNLKRFCNFAGMTPDELIDGAKSGTYSPDDDLEKFLVDKVSVTAFYIIIKSFYVANGLSIKVPYPNYRMSESSTKEMTTVQLRQLCDYSDLEERSWILANSYMGLSVGKLLLLKVKDFRTENWDMPKNVYPVKIRLNVSNTFDYTTFIGEDAKNALKTYFEQRNLSSEDCPWNYGRHMILNDYFRRNCQKIGIWEKGRISPKSLEKRLQRILTESGMRHEWICYLFGQRPYIQKRSSKIDAPLDEELGIAYEKAYPKLRVYPRENENVTL